MKTKEDKVKGKDAKREFRDVRVQAMISESLLKKLQERAAREHRTLSHTIELLLREAVDK
jgi:hypothetical protein